MVTNLTGRFVGEGWLQWRRTPRSVDRFFSPLASADYRFLQ